MPESLRILLQASTVLVESLDYEKTLASVARLCVPELADWCTVDMVSADGAIHRLAVAHVDPAKVEYAHELDRRYPLRADDPGGVPQVLRTGQSSMVSDVPDEMLVQSARDPEHLQLLRALGFRSVMIVPLVSRGQTLGAISFIIAESSHRYGPQNLALAEDLARRAAAAVDNARLYRETQEREQHFKAVFNQAAMGIAEADPGGQFLLVNGRFCEIVGYSRSELMGMTVEQVTHPDDRLRNRALYERVVQGRESYGIEKRYVRKDGSIVWVQNRVSFVPKIGARNGFCLAIVEDITERKHRQDELRRAKQDAEAANASKDHFLAVLSHELRTPLTPVLTMVQVLESEPAFPAELRSSIEMIRRNVEMEARLIDDLLDLTRIAKGKLQLSLETVDAHAALRSAIDICRSDMADKAVRVAVELRAGEHHVSADPARLQQVFWNLIKNAVKFTPTGGQVTIRTSNREKGSNEGSGVGGQGSNEGSGVRGQGSVKKSALTPNPQSLTPHLTPDPQPLTPNPRPLTPKLVVEITDTGIGIEPESLGRIFFAFEQGEQSITRQFGGLGLGLAISKSLIDMLGGDLGASSAGKDMGATFIARLPTVPAPVDVSISPSDRNGERLPRSLRILMVDDHEDTSRAMKRLLERLGYTVHAEHTVRDAIDAANAATYDLLISDIGLPDGSGVDLIRQLRQNANPIRAVALSGFGMDEDIRRSKEAGFQDHLTKPVNFSRLQEVIEGLVSQNPNDEIRMTNQ